ncbi:Detected protein of unknown function [Hibiscus syriacus]|uniref:Pentatricopeptide repeat-containing protein n=1 Tax=Hibiscus syriacus TaxID=106335 RepID=A0A6A2WY90_HIBSY|nr:Detected protein of unknown function [Hibiscus syriacus]
METLSTPLLSLQRCSAPPTVNNDHDHPVFLHIKRCTNSSQLKQIHAQMLRTGLLFDPFSSSKLFAASVLLPFWSLDYARKVFGQIPKPNLYTWNTLIRVYASSPEPLEGILIFLRMASLGADVFISNSLIHLYISCGDLDSAYRVFMMVGEKDVSWNSMITGLAQGVVLKSLEGAKRLFDMMKEKDIVTWMAMLDGYAKFGAYDEARQVLDSMPRQDIAAWIALLSGYEQNRKSKDALSIYHELQQSKIAKPDKITLVSTLSACSQLRAMEVGLAMHGQGKAATDLFSRMQETKIRPNSVTFTNVLCACSHAELVKEGKTFLDMMEPVYGIVPEIQHYSCMVDILGHAGLLEEAVEFIEKMPILPTDSVWGALPGDCQIHGNFELAELACSRCLLDPENNGAYILLANANVYAKTGKWDGVARLRKHMRVTGLKKEQGCSRIEVNGVIHEFLAGGNYHPLSKEIYSKLDEIVARLKSAGYIPSKTHLLQLIEEDDMQEHALNLHS